ncbi:LacI family transcriptional regulator [Pseudotabrizicola sp.]|uniref:LacI family transcriptional regulator n=1 Tax=Pseudotabrizicola sp. TaxID=2939647 RepID=UPI00272562A7|nr:LacI family transcriptional regulator [Pseudotabrizicola sp.]MDO8883881.1 LacI family transcriptional regulator [Pseudotabrizicola sp.]
MTSGVDIPLRHPAPDSEPERPTLKTIAAETGLAVATVSRALKDAPDIGEATKRRVREAATRLGYRPNRAGVRLRTGKTNVIALVLSTESDVMNHTSQLIYSIANALRGTAYHLIVTPYFPDQDPMDPIRYLVETESADAIILNQTKPEDPRVRYMTDRHFPFATHGRTDMGIEHSYYDFDNEAFGIAAVEALAAAGRKRLLLVPPPRTHSYARHMTTGFVQAAGAHGLAFEVLTTATSDSGGTAIEEAVMEHLANSTPRPDGLLCGSTTAAMAAVNAAERLGLVLGQDFDLVAKEAIRFLHRFRPDILVVHEDVREAGDFLARAVVAAVERRDTPAKQGLERPGSVDRGRDNKGGSS